jgi:hypothetical protein
MKLFKRGAREPQQTTCPRCTQLIARDALECPMCGLDLREHDAASPVPAAVSRDRTP